MRSRQLSFRVTWKLYDELKGLSQKQGYKNLSRFLTALALLAIQDKRRKEWVRAIANADPKLQDYLIDRMLGFPTDLKGMLEMMKRLDAQNSPRR